MKILIVEPGQYARPAEISGTLKEMQSIVGGTIQAVYPWREPVALVCNDEGKILDLPLNRALKKYGVISGPFFVCGIGREEFCGLNDQQMKAYGDKLYSPEWFYSTPTGILVKRCSPEEYALKQKALETRKKSAQSKNEQER